jgi:Flp pilus assembly secretin CpaC
MRITRRSLLGTGLGIAATAGVLRTALASEQGGGGQEGGDAQELGQGFEEGGPISYIPVKQVMIATRLLVVSNDSLYATGLDNAVKARDEDKINLGEIPLIGGLVDESGLFPDLLTREDFAPAKRIGTAYGAGESLIVDLSLPERPVSTIVEAVLAEDDVTQPRQVMIEAKLLETVVVANGGYSFHVGGHRLQRVDPKSKVPVLGDLPILGQAFRTGTAYRLRKDNLLILIKPTILFPEED